MRSWCGAKIFDQASVGASEYSRIAVATSRFCGAQLDWFGLSLAQSRRNFIRSSPWLHFDSRPLAAIKFSEMLHGSKVDRFD